MNEPVIVLYVFDELNRYIHCIKLKKNGSEELLHDDCDESGVDKYRENFSSVFKVDGYFFSIFTKLLQVSPVYYELVTNHFLNNLKHNSSESEISAKFQLIQPKAEVLDYAWNGRLCNLLFERQELEHAMSWLSTLGGAFSALGDNFENCAKVAGKISLQQFKIAFRLGEPPLVARCRLYMALSLIQLGKLGTARRMVEEQYKLAKLFKDTKLQNMCKGIWAKLQYIHKLTRNCKKCVN